MENEREKILCQYFREKNIDAGWADHPGRVTVHADGKEYVLSLEREPVIERFSTSEKVRVRDPDTNWPGEFVSGFSWLEWNEHPGYADTESVYVSVFIREPDDSPDWLYNPISTQVKAFDGVHLEDKSGSTKLIQHHNGAGYYLVESEEMGAFK